MAIALLCLLSAVAVVLGAIVPSNGASVAYAEPAVETPPVPAEENAAGEADGPGASPEQGGAEDPGAEDPGTAETGGEAGGETDGGTSDAASDGAGSDAPADGEDTAGRNGGESSDAPASEALASDAPEVEVGVLSLPPDNSAPIASGQAPTVTSTMSPSTDALPSGTPRVFSVSYLNDSTSPLTNARLWHQIMVRAGHDTAFTVSCASEIDGVAGGGCPDWVPTGVQTISGAAREYSDTYAGVFSFAAKQKLTFTVTVTSSFAAGACTETGTATAGGWARYSRTGFTIADIDGGASSVGTLTGAAVCPPGDIVMTNTVTSPRPPGQAPLRVLSGDARVFTASWHNAGTSGYTGVPIDYSYSVPLSGQVTKAVLTCVSEINGVQSGSCPAFMSGDTSIVHSHPDEAEVVVFGGQASFAAGQKYTVTVTLSTTINACTQDGYLRVKSYAERGAIGAETSGRTKTSELVEIGCSTWLLDSGFSGTTMPDPNWKGLGKACLTRSTTPGVNGGQLGQCQFRNQSPRVEFESPVGTPKGFLQLTDERQNQVGAALYDRALPAADGLVVEFTTYQYGNAANASSADGIGFFLADGRYALGTTGADGGALGYGFRPANTSEQGLPHGYLGVGFDVWGNYVESSHISTDCNQTTGYTQTPQTVALRGPGNGRSGYCVVAKTTAPSGQRIDKPSAAISGSGTAYDNTVRTALTNAGRKVRVTIYPLESGQQGPRVTVEMDFNEGYYRTLLDHQMTEPVPPLVKFGFLGSTGGSVQTHLIDMVRVGTVVPMKELKLIKTIDFEANADPTRTSFDVGDTINYRFTVLNASSEEGAGSSGIHAIEIEDPLISNVSCPGTALQRLENMECTGSLVVTEANRTAGRVLNTATVRGAISSEPGAPKPLSDRSSAEAAVNPTAAGALRVIAPGGTASFQVLKLGTALGLVDPDDPSKIAIKLVNPTTGLLVDGPITVSGQGTWALDASNRVTFTPVNSTYTGTVTPLKYEARNQYGGSAQGTLEVQIRTLPLRVCTTPESRQSDRIWAIGNTALFTFPAEGTGDPAAAAINNVSGGLGTFTVTDSAGALEFVVDGGDGGKIVKADGTVMLNGLNTATGGTAPNAGPSQVTAFPAGQGTGRFFVVASSASSTAEGQLRYWLVDMSLSSGTGAVAAGPALLGTGVASSAVTAVPNADGTGYWVISPNKRGNTIWAYEFDSDGPTGISQSTSIGTGPVPATGSITGSRSYEDIRFRADLGKVATIASYGTTSQLRLLEFNAATGALVRGVTSTTNYQRSWSTTSAIGYSVELDPAGGFLYASQIGTSGTSSLVQRRTISASELSNSSARVGAANANASGGAIRMAIEGSRLYLAANGMQYIRFQDAPTTVNTSTAWSQLATTGPGATSGWGLSQTLTDCAIPPAAFRVEKLDSDGVLVGGAEFALYPDAGGSAGGTPVVPTAGATGVFDFASVAPGLYWLRETKAPNGHSPLVEDVLIEVGLRGVVRLDGIPNPQVKLVNNAGSYTLRITNARSLLLPFAGGQSTGLFGGGLALLLAALIGARWWRGRRRTGPRARPDPAQ
ncbi:MAG: SpaA isopeptide-forming pilin-related protein [Leucobacter sp.]